MKQLFLLASVAALAASVVSAQQKLTIPVKYVPANDGKQMFVNYCAPCHGVDGQGNGVQAAILSTRPADLTQLRNSNKGNFPADHLAAVLKYGPEDIGHGSKVMPNWGPALRNVQSYEKSETQSLRIANLVRYVETLQK